MATAIVSIASRLAGLEALSLALLWLALLAFAPLAVLDLGRARHPLALLHRAGEPAQGFAALGFVADTCVLGARITDRHGSIEVVGAALLGAGAAVWVVIVIALVRSRADRHAVEAKGEWLLAVVATEGLAALSVRLASVSGSLVLRETGRVLWILGGVQYLAIIVALTMRLRRRPLRAGELTPDWWIVMGAAAIFALASGTLREAATGPAGTIGVLAWAIATVWIPVLIAGELWQAWRTGPPVFTPGRWTMVFPFGMYSAASQLLGRVLDHPWLTDVGRGWLAVALAAWTTVAAGEVHHAFMRPA